jgi:hypothetical protein
MKVLMVGRENPMRGRDLCEDVLWLCLVLNRRSSEHNAAPQVSLLDRVTQRSSLATNIYERVSRYSSCTDGLWAGDQCSIFL